MPRSPKPVDIWPAERRPWGAWLREHRRVARDSFGFVSGRLGYTLLVWLLIGIALALPAALYLLEINLARAAGDWRGAAGLSVYFRVDGDDEAASALAERLAKNRDVDGVRLTTPEQALDEFSRQAGASEALALLGSNPLPATLRVVLADDVPTARVQLLAKRIQDDEAVEDVVVEKTWLERLAAIRAVVERLSWIVAVLLGLGAMLVVSASIRLAVEARLAELQVLTLVGANRRAMRRPFLYLGAIYGVGGAVAAAMLVSLMLIWLENPLQRLFASYGGDLKLAGFDPTFIAAMLTTGAVLGVLGAVFASNQRLKELTFV